jgi:MFS transporter, MCT family, solute carrier family 16 (monocarboxylic acid transporters), member 10
MIPTTFLAAVTTFVWPLARSVGSLITIAVIYGYAIPFFTTIHINFPNRIASGTFVSLLPLPLIRMGEVGDVGRRSGMLLTVTSISALCGPPISGAIAQRAGEYQAVAYYAGKSLFVTTLYQLPNSNFRRNHSPLCLLDVIDPLSIVR